MVEAARSRRRAISRTPCPWARSSAISSRSANSRYRPDGGFDDGANPAGGMPPASRNQRVPTAGDTPATDTASSLDCPCAIAAQNCRRSSRCAAGGRPGDRRASRPDRSECRFGFFIATSFVRLLRRPLESAQYVSIKYTERLTGAGVEPSVGSVGDSFDNALAETINGLYKTEVIRRRSPWRNLE